jgi:hypothetical protein
MMFSRHRADLLSYAGVQVCVSELVPQGYPVEQKSDNDETVACCPCCHLPPLLQGGTSNAANFKGSSSFSRTTLGVNEYR